MTRITNYMLDAHLDILNSYATRAYELAYYNGRAHLVDALTRTNITSGTRREVFHAICAITDILANEYVYEDERSTS